MEDLLGKLEAYEKSDYYGFHMPGHKRNIELMDTHLPYGIDITEIEGFDDLHHPKEILKEGQERAAKVFGASKSFYLINGSTVGILSSILGCTNRGNQVLVARNCHKSVYNAIFLNELNPTYIYPKFEKESSINGEIQKSDVEDLLEKTPDIKAIIIASPTYDGVVSDVQEIAKCAHSRGIPLIVDEAHGAHFGFHSYFPQNSNEAGADIVIHSIHKTLLSLTQSALLHVNGDLVDRNRIRKYLQIFQSSSPSYVLMSSIDLCVRKLERERHALFEPYVERLKKLRDRLRKMKNLELLEMQNQEPSKILISTKNTNLPSQGLYERLLQDYHLQLEMVGETYIVAMTSIGDKEEGFIRLADALEEIDRGLTRNKQQDSSVLLEMPCPMKRYTAGEIGKRIEDMSHEEKAKRVFFIPLAKSEGIVALEYAYIYPPGIPLIVPGERISREVVQQFMKASQGKGSLKGLRKEGFIEGMIDG